MKIALVLLLFLSLNSLGQNFPESFVGKWEGKLNWYPSGKPMQTVSMQLFIFPDKNTGHFRWSLKYGEGGTDNRPYTLKAVDSVKGHWCIDEHNGIILDQYWLGNKLQGVFTTGNSTIVNTYYIEAGKLIVEFISINAKPVSTTGKGTEEIPSVHSYFVKSYQRAVLSKQMPH